jgi:hypothetical protein
MSKDYLRLSDAKFDGRFKFMNEYIAQKCGGNAPEWTHIPPAARTVLINAYGTCNT